MSLVPKLPVETLERILYFTFSLDTLAIPTASPTPPEGTFSLLFVSKGFLQLVLPFFYRSITIDKPSDWSSLFSPTNGVLVVGNDAGRRREWVQELNIDADVPIDFERVKQVINDGGDAEKIENLFIEVAEVHLPNLRHVCLLQAVTDEDGEERWEAEQEKLFDVLECTIHEHHTQFEIRDKLKKGKTALFERLFSSSPILSVDLSLSRHFLHSQIWRHAYPQATLILHVDKGDFQGPFELDDDNGVFDGMRFNWKKDDHYFFDDDGMLLAALPSEFKQMEQFVTANAWSFEKGVAVVGVLKMMVNKILRTIFTEHAAGVKSLKMTKKKWVWLKELDDKAIQREIERGRKTELILPAPGVWRDNFKLKE